MVKSQNALLKSLRKTLDNQSARCQLMPSRLRRSYRYVPICFNRMENLLFFLHSWVSAKFRVLCWVTKNSTPWPTNLTIERTNPATTEVYWNPWFKHSVLYEENINIFKTVASAVMMDFKVSYLTSINSMTHLRIGVPEYGVVSSLAFWWKLSVEPGDAFWLRQRLLSGL